MRARPPAESIKRAEEARGGGFMTDRGRVFNALFLCAGNSARSILAECILNRIGRPGFRAISAGSQPKGAVHPYALDLLGKLDYPVETLRSKSWE